MFLSQIQLPDGFLFFPSVAGAEEELVKAGPGVHEKRRMLYLRSSTERLDHEDEVVDASALAKGAPYFLTNGWLDWNHYSNPARLPMELAKAGHVPQQYIIGRPLDCRMDGKRETYVKGYLHKGRKAADETWELARQDPGALRASVGGGYLERERAFSKAHGKYINRVTGVHWNHLAVCPEGVNPATAVSARPIGPFLKSLPDFQVFCPDSSGASCSSCGKCDLSKALATQPGAGTSMRAVMPQDLEGAAHVENGPGFSTGNHNCPHFVGNTDKFKSDGAALDHMVHCCRVPIHHALQLIATANLRRRLAPNGGM